MLTDIQLKRFVVNKIFGKSKSIPEPFSEDASDLCVLDSEGLSLLEKRIINCLNHKSKFFELTLENDSEGSCFDLQRNLNGHDNPNFVRTTNEIANLAALSHKTGKIPDGLILTIQAKFGALDGVILVKAEKSDAFSANETGLSLVKDIFLSSDKTLYKIGVFLRTDKENINKSSFKYFVYDDAFTPSKNDLAIYFYNYFLGFSTEENGKIQTNNLCKDLIRMTNDYVHLGDRGRVQDRIAQIFHDKRLVTISASNFKGVFPEELDTLFESEIEAKYPNAIVKDTSMVTVLEKRKISLTENAVVTLKNWQDGIITGNTSRFDDIEKLKVSVDSGSNFSFLLVPSIMPTLDENS